ncbi:MAG: L-fucose/L-arabinose isomerase family protein [Candidatus Jordarchaeum sp.]|uniref:L-fucose/L-arabinose isomerase family protein n=1 Tax=Candidatus Jordarchaeum sp. TaxID=2823881 RepID=UPI004049FA73
MDKPRVGVLTVTDPREEFYERMLKDGVDMRELERLLHTELIKLLQDGGAEVIDGVKADSKENALDIVSGLIKLGIESLILCVPGWTYPSIGVVVAKSAETHSVPVLMVAPMALSGPLALKGAFDDVGIKAKTIFISGAINNPEAVSEVLAFVKAATAVNRLRGSTMGVIGGRSMGMYTATTDPSQVQRIFGVDLEHVDQLELIREAENVPREVVQQYMKWLHENCKVVKDGVIVTEEKLEKQVRSYVAAKKLVASMGFDFVGLKCQPELSDRFVNQCLTPTFLNDPYDAEGLKDTTACACEADINGALTMQILKLLNLGKPVYFGDILFWNQDEKLFTVANCGGAGTWFVKRSSEPEENLRGIQLVPQVQGKAGGAAVYYVAEEGVPVTWARLSRAYGEYQMFIIRGRIVRSEAFEGALKWPTMSIAVEVDPNEILEFYSSQHIQLVIGDVSREILEFCRLLNIVSIIF